MFPGGPNEICKLIPFFHKTRMLVDMGIVEKYMYPVLGLCHASDLRCGVNGYVDPRHPEDVNSKEIYYYATG